MEYLKLFPKSKRGEIEKLVANNKEVEILILYGEWFISVVTNIIEKITAISKEKISVECELVEKNKSALRITFMPKQSINEPTLRYGFFVSHKLTNDYSSPSSRIEEAINIAQKYKTYSLDTERVNREFIFTLFDKEQDNSIAQKPENKCYCTTAIQLVALVVAHISDSLKIPPYHIGVNASFKNTSSKTPVITISFFPNKERFKFTKDPIPDLSNFTVITVPEKFREYKTFTDTDLNFEAQKIGDKFIKEYRKIFTPESIDGLIDEINPF